MILKIGNIGLIRNPEMVFLNDFKILLEPYIKCEFFDAQDFKDVISKEQAFEIIQDNLINGVPLNNIALEIYLDDENIRIDGNGTYAKDCIKFVNGFDAMKNMDKLLEPFSKYLSFSKNELFKISFIDEDYKNSLERIINIPSAQELMSIPVEERLLTVLYGVRFKSSYLDFLLDHLSQLNSVTFYEDEKHNEFLRLLLKGLRNRGSEFSHERESEQERFKRGKEENMSQELTPKEEVDKYCSNCGEEEDFTYIRTTASGYVEKGTKHYTCNSCGEELSFVEDL